jgi:hypothetical protein
MAQYLKFNFDAPKHKTYRETIDGITVIRPEWITAKERDITIKWAKRCIREATKKDYELGVTAEQVRRGLTITLKASGWVCYGGSRGITMDVYVLRNSVSRFSEYKAIASDPTIGTIAEAEPEVIYGAIVAHEIAHHLQRRYGPQVRWLKSKHKKPHGHGWQALYRILRRGVVNKHLPK